MHNRAPKSTHARLRQRAILVALAHRGLTRADLARQFPQVSRGFVYRVIRGEARSRPLERRICDALQLDWTELWGDAA